MEGKYFSWVKVMRQTHMRTAINMLALQVNKLARLKVLILLFLLLSRKLGKLLSETLTSGIFYMLVVLKQLSNDKMVA